MKYPYSESEFLQIQKLIYTKKIEILNEEVLADIQYSVVERPILYCPPKETRHRKYTENVNPRLRELSEMRNQIIHEVLWCLACDRASDESKAPTRGFLRYIERERFFKIAVYDLFSYRERIAYLIYELFDRRIITGSKTKVDFNNVYLKVLDLNVTEFDWITESEMQKIKSELLKLKEDRAIKEIVKVRHAFTHRSSPGIDCMSLQLHEYKRITGDSLIMQREFSKSRGEENWSKHEFISLRGKSAEQEKSFKEISLDMLMAWETLSSAMKNLIDDIQIIKDEIEKLAW